MTTKYVQRKRKSRIDWLNFAVGFVWSAGLAGSLLLSTAKKQDLYNRSQLIDPARVYVKAYQITKTQYKASSIVHSAILPTVAPYTAPQYSRIDDIKAYICSDNFKWDCKIAIAVFTCESHLRETAYNPRNSNGSWDAGVAQINSVHGYSRAYLFNYVNNISVAYNIYTHSGWYPWSCYKWGGYKEYL
jgi:hypothetical protein